MPPVVNVTGVVLAGGKSSRFGENKAFVPFRGVPVIKRVIEVLKKSFSEILIVTNTPEQYGGLGLPVVKDITPDQGPLGGIVTAFRNTGNDRIFVVGCDMPILDAPTIEKIIAMDRDVEAAIPVHDGIREYLMALYSRRLLPWMGCCLAEGKLSLHSFFDHLSNVVWIPVEGISWFNVNTTKDLEFLEKNHAD